MKAVIFICLLVLVISPGVSMQRAKPNNNSTSSTNSSSPTAAGRAKINTTSHPIEQPVLIGPVWNQSNIDPTVDISSRTVNSSGLFVFTLPRTRFHAEYLCRLNFKQLLSMDKATENLPVLVDLFKTNAPSNYVEIWVKGEPCQERKWTRKSKKSWFFSSEYMEEHETACRGLALMQEGNVPMFITTRVQCDSTAYVTCF